MEARGGDINEKEKPRAREPRGVRRSGRRVLSPPWYGAAADGGERIGLNSGTLDLLYGEARTPGEKFARNGA
jgi:hypothetical protein